MPSPLRFTLAVLGLVTGCGAPETGPPPLPTSPVGHYETTSHRHEGDETRPEGTVGHRIRPLLSITIDVRADGTFRYAWRYVAEPKKSEGNLEGKWRSRYSKVDGTPDGTSWVLEANADPGTERFMSYSGHPPPGVSDVRLVAPGLWIVPGVDPETAKLTDAVMFISAAPK